MRKVLLVLIVIMIGTVALNPSLSFQSSPSRRTFVEPDDDLDEFVGKVKTIYVETEEHEFTSHFMDFGNRYKRIPFQTGKFDRDGRKLEKFNYRTDGVPLPKTTYSYNKSGLLLREHHFSAVSGKPYLETLYIYDSHGRVREVIGQNLEDKKVLNRKVYSHDEKRNSTEIVEYDGKNAFRGKMVIFWNSAAKVAEVVSSSARCKGECRGKWIYDAKSRAVEMTVTSATLSEVQKEKYEYEDDQHGNWTKKTLYYWVTEEGNSFYKLMNITYRKLTYY
jgi:hypothetical protein